MKHLYVIYVGIKNLPHDQWDIFLEKTTNAFKNTLKIDEDSNYIFVPDITKSNTEIVCINPLYIKEEELIKKHEEELDKFNKEFNKKIKEFVYENK